MRALLMGLVLALGPMTTAGTMTLAYGQEAQENAWELAITTQIEAFREADGVTALEFAGAGFKAQFEGQPEIFYTAILNSGYGPIVDSRSHSFGSFDMIGDTGVLQVVRFVGPDQGLYEALYQMLEEADGWRVQGVVLREDEGVGI